MRCNPFIRAALLLAVAVFWAPVLIPAASAQGAPNVPCPTYRRAEVRMARLSNDAREEQGRQAFVLDRELSRVARTHTADMIERQELEHTAPAQLAGWTTNWVELTENIGKGSNAESLFETFMHSAPHRHRILSGRYNHIGIGILRDDQGQMWVTMVFESRRDPGTSLPRPACG